MRTNTPISLPRLLGPKGPVICKAMRAARGYLQSNSPSSLLSHVGETIREIPRAAHLDKRFIQKSYRGDVTQPPDDLLTGQGLFYITEQRKLFLDCTGGHYQMTWGYFHPELEAAVREALETGVVWDDHSNIPGNTVKRLSERLVAIANGLTSAPARLIQDGNALNTVLLGVCTGSVAASSALKIALRCHEAARPKVEPVFISLNGNYHGTDFLAQRLRGMWPSYLRNAHFIQVEPNDIKALRNAFNKHRGRVAAFFFEPILMNREALLLKEDFVREARALCDKGRALMVVDEIQTGFWCPEVFMFRQYSIVPDIVIVGKGMTAGFHPLSAIVYKRKLDCLAQYDAISTNGGAPLAALVGLGCLALIVRDRKRIADLSRHYFQRLQEIPKTYPSLVSAIHGKGLLAGIKFKEVKDALTFHRRCVERGLWVRVHAYHEGHSTVLTKLGLAADKRIADFIVDTFLQVLQEVKNE